MKNVKKIVACVLAAVIVLTTIVVLIVSNISANKLRVAVTSDLVGLGFADMMVSAEQNNNNKDYKGYEFVFSVVDSYTTAATLLEQKKVDVIAVPTDFAARMYTQSKGKYTMFAVTSTAPLYILSSGDDVGKMSDLRSKIIYAKKRGSASDIILSVVLKGNRLDPRINTTVEYFDTNAQVRDAFYFKEKSLAYFDEPAASSVSSSSEFVNPVIDIAAEYNKLDPDTDLNYNCLLTTKKIAKKKTKLLKELVLGYEESYKKIDTLNYKDLISTVKKTSLKSIVNAVEISSHKKLTALAGENMGIMTERYLKMLYDIEPAVVLSYLPDQEFYFDIYKE